jgi:hypothetical protein
VERRGGGRSDSVLHLRPFKKNLFGDISGWVQSTGIVKEALFFFFFLPTIKENEVGEKEGSSLSAVPRRLPGRLNR